MPQPDGQWIEEVYHQDSGIKFKVSETLFSGKSPYQAVDVVQTTTHGRMLLCDGKIMLCERDEFVYHEMITHVPLFVHPAPRRVLIIGGGDGGAAREALRHPGVTQVVLVEIDEMVVNASREFLPSCARSFDDPRMRLVVGDGLAFVTSGPEPFDVVIVDSTDPVGPAEDLFGSGFYSDVKQILNPGGIMVAQAESPFYDGPFQKQMLDAQKAHFSTVALYLLSNLTYPGGLWGLSFASNGPDPVKDLDPDRVAASGLMFQYYSANVHKAAFCLPAFVARTVISAAAPTP